MDKVCERLIEVTLRGCFHDHQIRRPSTSSSLSVRDRPWEESGVTWSSAIVPVQYRPSASHLPSFMRKRRVSNAIRTSGSRLPSGVRSEVPSDVAATRPPLLRGATERTGGPTITALRSRIIKMDRLSDDVDPDETLGLLIPDRSFAENRLIVHCHINRAESR